ncbi:AfsR/SARP family transcriptional regulator [Actinocrispum wychmicini]|uniref:DNA-binding SARP family transcriptional activator n=1 Tax=Actinocrispum wychmicini TaxID=1213861 RepID=A0A4R2JZL4_9PSEU|nr:BTAD domain-containing putative transcriptional regulator [Actinocrispum wychmicini]TCO62749.1 DNA-binding SARP family transcriptional activator [Actinocrispum wychmicini]
MEFRLLGEVQLAAGGRHLDLGTPRQQAVLAALAVDAGRPVPIETLVDRVWNDAPPVEARNVLYSHLSRIRQLLNNAAQATGMTAGIDRRSAGYVLEINPDRIDMHRFTALVERGKDARVEDDERAAALSEALRLWRGPPLAGIKGDWGDQVRDSWHRRRLEAVELWGEIELRTGRFDAVITTVPDLVDEYPLAEQLEVLVIKALHAAGRDAEALDRFAVVRRRLADELGADPGPELRALHATILRGEPPVKSAKDSPLSTPAQLPPDVPGFVGRANELGRLDGVLRDGPRTVRIVTVSGTAGVGKTALVVHWAHRVRREFPDGQLYLNLRGFDPAGSPVTPAEAVRGLLDSFDVPHQRVPAGFDAQVGLWRSVLADRRVLIVLDNARDAEQVRPLLPGAPGCLVLVTSRDLLTGLVAAGAHPLPLDLLDSAGSRALLAARVGANRVTTESAAVDDIVATCARLPLALAVVAARAATHPHFTLTALAGQLSAARGSLDEFSSADPATDPRAVFSWSYLQLTDDAARLFRLLGLHAGPDISTQAAASLAGLPVARARRLVAELARAHLIAESAPGRFTCHDLLRAYAAEEADLIEYAADRTAAVRRVLAHYIHSANNADRLLDPRREEPPPLVELPQDVTPEQVADRAQAEAWFAAERAVLLGVVHQGPEFDAEVWEVVWLARRFLFHQGRFRDESTALAVALAAAQRLGDPVRQAFAHCYLGCIAVWLDRYDEAAEGFDAAFDLYRDAADLIGQAYVEHYRSWMLERQNRIAQASTHAERALELFRAAGHRAGQAKCLNAVGWFHALRGDHGKAIDYCEEALTLQTELGDQINAAQTWHSLGYSHEHLGRHQQAVRCYQTAVNLFRENSYRRGEAIALTSLGETHQVMGDLAAARQAWQGALDIYDQLGSPDAEQLRAKLATITP